jgi:hypothetical protein
LICEHRRTLQRRPAFLSSQLYLAASFLSTVLVTNAYFAWKAGIARFLDSTILFVIRYYPAYSWANTYRSYLLSPPSLQPWYRLPWVAVYWSVHILIPGIYLVFWVRYRKESRRQPQHPWDRLMLVSLTGFFLFMSIAPAPSFFRLCEVSLPAWILLVWLLTFPAKPERVLARFACMFAFLMVILEPVKAQRRLGPYLTLPPGRAAIPETDLRELYKWLSEHTRPSEWFFEASWSDTYFALGLHNPAPVPFITNTDYTRPEQVGAVVEALETAHVRLVLWSPWLEVPEGVSTSGDHLGPLRDYLRSHYHVVTTFTDGKQIWERDPSPP